ncbi:ABC transporter permease [Nocardioides donggukensis]|uniref:ABC transporter permease n=1 Tax=Nocardioides donggukensis TaxID=2774019 RepID=A0A927K7U4_9ACTN|nr:ABC transporter permease [Nocardioides donggukensis]MBD8870593.1 ABC transporter permease [Nocardioides donggukensis]
MSTPVWRIVAEREVSTRLRDKTFVGATIFTMLFLVGFFVVISVVDGGAEEYDVAITQPADTRILDVAQASLRSTGSEDAEITAADAVDADAAEALVRDGDVDAALLPTGGGYEIVGDEGIGASLRAALASAVASQALTANAAEQDVDLDALNADTQVGQRLLDPNAEESSARSGVAFAFALVFFITALGFGMTIAQSVAREKESRVVEILAAAVPIRALLWGKIIGNTALALGQVLLFVTIGLVGLAVTGRGELLAGISWAVAWYVAFFVLGFVALAALWSVAGALASRQEDLQSTTLPGQLILIVPYFVSTLASDKVQAVVSVLPIVSTMVMPGRMAQGEVPWWQVAIAVLVTVAAAVAFVRVGSRLYERTLLRTGGRIKYGEAFRLSD